MAFIATAFVINLIVKHVMPHLDERCSDSGTFGYSRLFPTRRSRTNIYREHFAFNYTTLQLTKLYRPELHANDVMRRSNAPRPFLLRRRVSIIIVTLS
ncbi:hypothetical protein EVAR_53400_1 [Eumeta japonica]|uniref:Uncharacterized protein n=1 Tax=Eumeta variegata TaxID=151549 RepID=A0A4C1XPE8_EUMVA|nr:hypothetical protein EVAR_53400_1 [Eumeta japonica]